MIAPAISAMVKIDDLRHVGQGGERRLVQRVVRTGSTVKEQQRRDVTHRVAVRSEPQALCVEEEVNAVDQHAHVRRRSRQR